MRKFKFPTLRKIKRNLALASKAGAKKTLTHFQKNFYKGGYEEESGKFVRWAERKKKYKHKLLKKTKRLEKSYKLSFKKEGFNIQNVAPYSKYVQEGSKNNEERPLLYNSKELDEIMLKEINKKILDLFSPKRRGR